MTNEQIALRSLELICNADTGAAVDEVMHPAAVSRRGPGTGPDGFRGVIGYLNSAFADIAITPSEVLAAGDVVAARTRFRGLHVGAFNGVEPTHRTIEIDQIHWWRLEDGLVREHFACMDEVSGFRQMGVALP